MVFLFINARLLGACWSLVRYDLFFYPIWLGLPCALPSAFVYPNAGTDIMPTSGQQTLALPVVALFGDGCISFCSATFSRHAS